MHMQPIETNSEEENEYSVAYWRRQFAQIRPRLDKNWHQQLASFDPSLDSLKGATAMRAVAHGKASLVITQRIVSIAEQVLAKSRKTRRRSEKSVAERLRLSFG